MSLFTPDPRFCIARWTVAASIWPPGGADRRFPSRPSEHTSPLPAGPADDWQERGNTCFRTVFCHGCDPMLSTAAILVSTTLCITPPFQHGSGLPRAQGRPRIGESGTHPAFWYLTLAGAFTALVIGLVLGCVVGVRARHSQASGLTFLREDWVGRVAAVAGCLVLGMFALPVGMAVFSRTSAYRAVDGMMTMEVVGLGVVCVPGVLGVAGSGICGVVFGARRMAQAQVV